MDVNGSVDANASDSAAKSVQWNADSTGIRNLPMPQIRVIATYGDSLRFRRIQMVTPVEIPVVTMQI